jgi:hypothetical protein
MFNSVLFPAPEGPRMAVSCPDLKRPLTLLRMIFFPANKASVGIRAVNDEKQEELRKELKACFPAP